MRKSKPKKRYLLPDPKFSDTLVTKFVNYMMERGKKTVAYGIFYDAIEQVEKRPERKINLSIKWLIDYARARGEKTMMDKLAAEIMAASKGEGAAIKKKDDTHRMAEANKAFSHFRF